MGFPLVNPSYGSVALPGQIAVVGVRKLGPNQRIVAGVGNFLKCLGPAFTRFPLRRLACGFSGVTIVALRHVDEATGPGTCRCFT